jgi:hypothetical protein
MSSNVGNQINTAADTFQTWIDRTNALINAAATIMITAEAAPNGSLTTGNAFVNGVFGATTFTAGALRGGNVQSSAVLPVTSNVSVGNSTLNVEIGFGTLNVGSVTVNTTVIGVGNVSINTTAVGAGNSTVNSSMNSTVVSVGTGEFTTGANVGANVRANTTQITVGNVAVGLNGATIGNSTVNTVANSSSVTTDSVSARVSSGVGSNVGSNTTATWVGNSTVNAVMNSSVLTIGGGSFTTQINVGANVGANTTAYRVGNSTVNAVMNATTLVIANVSATHGAFTTVAIGTNVSLNSSGFSIGNSTVNVSANSTGFRVNGTPLTSNVIIQKNGTPVGNAGTLNLIEGADVNLAITVNGGTINVVVSAVNDEIPTAGGSNTQVQFNDSGAFGGAAGLTYNKTTNTVTVSNVFQVGANVVVNTSSHRVGNSTVAAFTNSTLTQLANSTVTSNLTVAGLATGNLVANQTHFRVGNSTVNAFMNSSAVSAPSASLSSNLQVGANVGANLTHLYAGNSSVNSLVNSTAVQVGAGSDFSRLLSNGIAVAAGASVALEANATQLHLYQADGPAYNAVMNSSALQFSWGNGNEALTLNFTGGNPFLNLHINSIYQTFINTTSMMIGNSTHGLSTNSSSLTINNISTRTSLNVGTFANVGTSIGVGANVTVNTSVMQFTKNATSELIVNSSSLFVQASNNMIYMNVALNGIRAHGTEWDAYHTPYAFTATHSSGNSVTVGANGVLITDGVKGKSAFIMPSACSPYGIGLIGDSDLDVAVINVLGDVGGNTWGLLDGQPFSEYTVNIKTLRLSGNGGPLYGQFMNSTGGVITGINGGVYLTPVGANNALANVRYRVGNATHGWIAGIGANDIKTTNGFGVRGSFKFIGGLRDHLVKPGVWPSAIGRFVYDGANLGFAEFALFCTNTTETVTDFRLICANTSMWANWTVTIDSDLTAFVF